MTAKNKTTLSLIIFLIIAISLSINLLRGNSRLMEKTQFLMGTVVEIKVSAAHGQDAQSIRKAIDRAFGEIIRIEGLFSVFKEDSDISRVNRLKAGDSLKLNEEVFGLVERSIEFSRKTNGAFDITVGPLVELWNRARSDKKVPGEDSIRLAKEKVGFENIILDKGGKTITLRREGVKLDLGGIAKGYATDRAIKALRECGVENAIVNSGGDMYCLGRRSARESWAVGIQHPRKRGGTFSRILLKDKAIDTSGDYEKYFLIDGIRYSHIIDPRTGYPVGDKVVSATVIADDSATADALATALCVLDPDEGLSIIESIGGADAVIVSSESGSLEVMTSNGFEERYGAVKEEI